MMYGRTPFYDKNRKVLSLFFIHLNLIYNLIYDFIFVFCLQLMFYRIINTEPSFPATFSPESCDCIRGLLRVNEEQRLGCGEQGAAEIMSTKFFSTIDFDKLYQREIVPPFQPEVTSETDTKYVPKAYLQAEAKDSIAEPVKKNDPNLGNFEAFTFSGDNRLSDGDNSKW